MEGYKNIRPGASVLSAPLCTWIFFSTLASYGLPGPLPVIINCLLIVLTGLTAFFTIRSYSSRLDSIKKTTAAAALLFLLLASLFVFIHSRIKGLTEDAGLPSGISGFTATIDTVDKKRYSSDLYFTHQPRPGLYVRGILSYTGNREINQGAVIAVHKNISRISQESNRFLSAMIREGIHFRGTVSDTEITVIDSGSKSWRASAQQTVREKIQATFPYPASALIIAIYFGDTTYLEKKFILQFRDAGTLHLLAASGMNIALVASLPVLLLVTAGIGRRKAILASAVVTCLYLLVTNMPVSLVRASAMYVFMITGTLLSRDKNPFNTLYLAGSCIILLMPWELLNPGFQLSFGATAGILFFYKRYKESLHVFPGFISKSLAVTFAAQLIAFPVIYLHMNQFNPAGFITNLVEIPMVTIITLLSLIVLGISIVSPALAALPALSVSFASSCIFNLNKYASSLKLNFFIDNNILVPAAVLVLSSFPLINLRFFNRMKAWPVFGALLAAIIILKYGRTETTVLTLLGERQNEVHVERERERLKVILAFNEKTPFDEEKIILLRKINPDIKIIEISQSTYNNITACRILINDFIIDECIVGNVKSINADFTGFLKILQKENIKVTIRNSDKS